MSLEFDPEILSQGDFNIAWKMLGSVPRLYRPDFIIAPDGKPYLYRWYIVPRNQLANVYFHIQVASDPERPLHDHPWDNMSVILSGGYSEHLFGGRVHPRRPGDVIQRRAPEAHRLVLPEGTPYTMTMFSTGINCRDWGFDFPDRWRSHKEVIENRDGVSVLKEAE